MSWCGKRTYSESDAPIRCLGEHKRRDESDHAFWRSVAVPSGNEQGRFNIRDDRPFAKAFRNFSETTNPHSSNNHIHGKIAIGNHVWNGALIGCTVAYSDFYGGDDVLNTDDFN